jgi:hypothetical protein
MSLLDVEVRLTGDLSNYSTADLLTIQHRTAGILAARAARWDRIDRALRDDSSSAADVIEIGYDLQEPRPMFEVVSSGVIEV